MLKRNRYDTIIVGAGPGGLKAAETLGRAGRSVLLLEKNEKIGPKICAGGLTVKDFGLGIPRNEADHLFNEVAFHTPKRRVTVKTEKPFVATIDREKLGQFMLRRLELMSSVEVYTGTRVTRADRDSVTVNGQKLTFGHLIGADGALSVVRRSLNLPSERTAVTMQYIVPEEYPRLEIFVDPDRFGPWYAWIFPHQGYTSIGTGGDPKTMDPKTLEKNFEEWLKEKKIDVSKGRFEGWPINVDYRGSQFGNVFLIGAAAGLTSALTGEGIYPAMISGMEAAKKILDPRYTCPELRRIVKTKQRHERILRLLMLGKTITRWEFELVAILLKNKWFAKKVIDFAA